MLTISIDTRKINQGKGWETTDNQSVGVGGGH